MYRELLLSADTVEKLDKFRGLFFCKLQTSKFIEFFNSTGTKLTPNPKLPVSAMMR